MNYTLVLRSIHEFEFINFIWSCFLINIKGSIPDLFSAFWFCIHRQLVNQSVSVMLTG